LDKTPIYPGQIPLDTNWLQPQRNTEIALGFLLQAAFGTNTVIDGLAVIPTSPASMQVKVGPGSIIVATTVDTLTSGFGSLPVDNADSLCKIGINLTPTTMSTLTAPAVAGQSQNWLIEAQFIEADGTPVVLPYYNAANPAVPYTGPANAGTTNNTARTNRVQLQWKGGTAAATGQQNTPSPDAGWTGVAIVTVTNGQSTITSPSIVPYSLAPFVPTKLPQLRKQLTADLSIFVSTFGNDTNNSGLSASSPFLTLQKAWNYIIGSLDLNGFNVTVSIANGTYTGALRASGTVVGLGSGNTVSFVGNIASPTSVVVSTTNLYCIAAVNGAAISVSGMKLTASGTDPNFLALAGGIVASSGGSCTIAGAMNFGLVSGNHVWVTAGSNVVANAISYTVSGGAGTHFNAGATGGSINVTGCAITVSGTPAFTTFAVAVHAGLLNISTTTITGSATGNRFSAQTNGVIDTSGSGASFFPGSVAGTTGNGGVSI